MNTGMNTEYPRKEPTAMDVLTREEPAQGQAPAVPAASAPAPAAWPLQAQALDKRYGPQRVLERGYAWLQDEAGHPVTRAAQTTPGQPLAATLADGKVDLRVLGRRSG